jgi:hypothetical protein
MSGDVKFVSYEIGALDGAAELIFKAPSANQGGGIRILYAYINGAGTATVNLADYGSAGTASAATIGSYGGTLVAGTPKALVMTAANQDLAAGHWLAVTESSGALSSGNISIAYVMGN